MKLIITYKDKTTEEIEYDKEIASITQSRLESLYNLDNIKDLKVITKTNKIGFKYVFMGRNPMPLNIMRKCLKNGLELSLYEPIIDGSPILKTRSISIYSYNNEDVSIRKADKKDLLYYIISSGLV